jgi:predicted amidohydrolase YtcJ
MRIDGGVRVLVVVPFVLGALGALGAERPADLIVHGGPIYTMDARQPRVDAVAVRDGRFTAVGAERDVMALRGPSTVLVDLSGGIAVPGLQDAHGHVLGLGATLDALELRDTASLAEVVARVREAARSAAPGAWILGGGWDQNDWPRAQWPTRADIDEAAAGHPVFLTRIDGHAALVNTAALAAAHVDRTRADPPGGRLLRGDDGMPTGVLVDAAQDLVERVIPPPTRAQIASRIIAADRALVRVGLTMVHDAGEPPSVVDVMARLVGDRRIDTRLYVMLGGEWDDAMRQRIARGPLIDPHHRLSVRAVKLYADGALGSRGAALLEDYSDEPGTRGLLVTDPRTLRERARTAVEAGFQVAVHAIGDRANRDVLDVYESLERDVAGARALRLRVEHAQVLTAADIPRFATLGVIASMQATHCTSDMPWAPARLGRARIDEGAYAWRKLIDSGAVLANGSDFPVEKPDPLLGFYAAITRQAPDGTPPGGWNPEERETRDEALRSLTLNAAYAAHAERDLGSIEPGKLADFVVLSKDIMTVAPREVLSAQVLRTVISGRTVFAAGK